ncbi:NucA/NucB deoxyribonuclease domain-containing protein [Labedaea rhizosphaerae]|uniref:Deoxyribonuclease NucA/NucB n=1 Tax=Labedaea rhizosphaerae TaxID=598644 RepID=A0A4R6SIK1_LABRH|nr:NucA/NucB deoxyribonuclease domain-containing protein [Labedaea rhizosphaerae]TDQ04106.1 deoxyribonuclease NucA/NucB [Labedaea rhizosphaerae]
MARSRTSTFVPLLIVLGVIAVLSPQLIGKVGGLFGDSEPTLIGTGETAFLVGSDGESEAERCDADELLRNRRCDKLKVVVIDAAKMPFIARNIKLAWTDGKPAVLTRNSTKRATNRAAACGGFVAKYPRGSCDEYAFATTEQGGAGARTEEVPLREQRCQGGAVNAGYVRANIQQGEDFLVVIWSPSDIAGSAFTGDDAAKDQSCDG